MSKQDYIRAGQMVKQHFEGQSSKATVLSDLETQELRRFGVEVMLAGGVEACKLMSCVSAVKEAALAVRTVGFAAAGHTEQQRRTEVMELCDPLDGGCGMCTRVCMLVYAWAVCASVRVCVCDSLPPGCTGIIPAYVVEV